MRKSIVLTAAVILSGGISAAVAAEVAAAPEASPTPAEKGYYVIPDDVRCYLRKSDRVTYCTDKQNTPITGELRKYADKELVRTYQLKNGIMDGISVSYYVRGGKMSEKPYVGGKLNGAVKNYYENGSVSEVIPYRNGKQEGVTKIYYENGYMMGQGIYVDGKLNGMSRVYDIQGNLVYELTYANNQLTAGYCMVKKTSDAKPQKLALTDEQIKLINQEKLVLAPIIGSKGCSFGDIETIKKASANINKITGKL